MKTRILLTVMILLLGIKVAPAQTTAFTYQGKLADGGNPANGNYDLSFQLFDTQAVGTGAQQGTTLSLTNVEVKGGIFTAQLDFGACASCLNGANRFLEIAVRPSGSGSFSTLSPRQPIASTPYAVKSLNATTADGLSLSCVSCVTSNQIQSVQGSQVAGNIAGIQINGTIPVASVPVGSANYIQNTTGQQPNSNFNISGNGVIGGNVGIGTALPTHKLHVIGKDIRLEGETPTTIPKVSWDFTGAEFDNRKWQIGATANQFQFSALDDAELGSRPWLQVNRAGMAITGVSFPVSKVGIGTLTPAYTLHITSGIKPNLRIESPNIGAPTLPYFSMSVGYGALNEKTWQSYATGPTLNFSALNDAENQEDIWLRVQRTGSLINNVVFPRGAKVSDESGTLSRPTLRVENSALGGTVASFGSNGEFQVDSIINGAAGRLVIKENGRVGIGTNNPADMLDVQGAIRMNGLGLGGNFALCQNPSHQISGCSSSLRYKTDLHPFTKGLNLLQRLRPLTFRWKSDQSLDLGLGAEDVAAVEPLLVTHNASGEVEGVKYDRLSAVFINAFKEQQDQIEQQQNQIEQQQSQISSLIAANARLGSRMRVLEQRPRKRTTGRRGR
jgi:hypothetical protein